MHGSNEEQFTNVTQEWMQEVLSTPDFWVPAELGGWSVQCNGVYKNLLTKILSGYFFAETRTSGGYPTLVYSILLNIATKLELWKATHAAKLELLEATLVTMESYKRRCTVYAGITYAPGTYTGHI